MKKIFVLILVLMLSISYTVIAETKKEEFIKKGDRAMMEAECKDGFFKSLEQRELYTFMALAYYLRALLSEELVVNIKPK